MWHFDKDSNGILYYIFSKTETSTVTLSSLTRSRQGPLRRSTMTASDSVSPHIGWGRWLSSRIWSSHHFGGRPGRRFHDMYDRI